MKSYSVYYAHLFDMSCEFPLLTIIPRVHVGYEMVDSQRGVSCRVGYNHVISNKHKWNNRFIKNAHKILRILSNFICENNQFSACFNFEQMHSATIFGEHGIMAHIP